MAKIKLRRDTATNWSSANPVLALGEPGYDTTNNKIKVGNGTTAWNSLDYLTSEGGGGGIGDTAAAIELTGTIPYTNDNVLSTVVNFTRPNNSNNTVDAIDTGLTIKRGNNGGIYNSADNVETNWNSNQSPLGTEWNADGWGDLTDVQTRTYTTFYNACDQNVGSVVTHKEFVMHDTINDKYYKIKFHFWQPNNGGGAAQSLDETSGFSYTRTLLDLSNGVYFVRGADDTNLGDEIGPGLTIKRDQAGGIYNSEVDAEWDPDNTPSGTLWNDDGWDDFTDITTRTWKPLYSAVHGQLGNHLVGAELLMHDTINDQYYTVKFTDWGQNNGGSFAYLRREINPTGTRLGITFADGSVQKTATTLGDLRVVDGNVFENAVQPGDGAEIRYDVKNNFYYDTNSWTGTANWVASGNDGYIQFDNSDTNNGNQVDFREFLNDLGRWHSKTVSINGGDPQTITNWSNNYIYTEDAPATDPTVVTEIRFYVTFRSRFYMGGENTVGFFLNDRDENFEVQSRDVNLYAYDDVRIRGRDLVEIRNNATEDGVRIVADGDNSSKTWEFMPDGSLQLPNLSSTGWNWNYGLQGSTLKLGTNQGQNIITGAAPTQIYPNAQRIIIQGQRGYGTWGQNTAGEGGDVYIWGGVGGESDGGGGSGGDIKVRGGQGQNSDGGYVKIEGGSAAGWNNSPTGGYVEIRGGDAVEGGNGNGGDVRIFGGKKHGTGNNGEVHVSTGANEEFEWKFDNGGTLTIPGDIYNSTEVNIITGAHPLVENVTIDAADTYGPGVWRLFALDSLYPTLGDTVTVGATVTTGWGTPVTATVTDVIHDTGAGFWVFIFDQDVITGFTPGDTATFGPGLKTWSFDENGLLNLPGNMLVGTLWPDDPMPSGDKESVVWAKDDTEYLGLWWGGSQTYPQGGYGPVAGVMIGSYDSPTDDFTNDPSPADTKVTIGVNDANGSTLTWHFDRDGTLTLPSSSTIKEVAAPIVGNAILLTPSGGNETTQALKIYPTEGGEGDHVHLTANGGTTELYLGDDSHYVKLVNGGNVEIRSGDMAGNTAVWSFGTDGTTTLPGAVVNSTVNKQPLIAGLMTAFISSPNTDPAWVDDTYHVTWTGGGSADIVISGSSYGSISNIVYGSSIWEIGDIVGSFNVGGTTNIVLTVDSINTTAPLDLTKSINKLTTGNYSLADGVEGQIMHLIPLEGTTPSSVEVIVDNYRIGGTGGSGGTLFPFRIYNDANASYFDSRGFCTLIFTDGHWQQSGGSWD